MSATFIENEKSSELITAKSLLEEAEKKIENDIVHNNIESNEEKQDKDKEKSESDEEETINEDSNQDEGEIDSKPEWVDLLGSGAIMKKILKEGTPGTRPQRNEKCLINYTMYLEDETSIESATNFELNLGESDVIQGLDVALGLMNVGERCRLKIEPRLAFGKKGLPSKIPADTAVIYEVELVRFEPEVDIELMTIGQRKTKGNQKRERGNWWYVRGENNIAIQCYRRALDFLDEVEGGNVTTGDNEKGEVSDSDLQSILEDRVSVCNNMAAAQIKMENYSAALTSLQIVLKCQPNNVKAHFRKAKAFIGKNDLPTAMKCLLKAKELAPNDPEIQKEITRLNKMLDKQKSTERELARRMFNGPIKSDTDIKKKSPGRKLALWGTLGAAIAIGAAGFIAYRLKV